MAQSSVDDPRWRPQRDVAARNEARLLAAGRALLNSSARMDVDMHAIADEAGVGVGTLYRRFGDKAGLLAAVIGEEERRLQQDVLSGSPPLGPGAPAAERVAAFLDALVALTERNLGVLLVIDSSPPGRLAVGAYRGWRLHIVTLLRQVRPDLGAKDVGWWADLLLSTVEPRLYDHQRRELRISRDHIAANAKRLATAITEW